MTPTRWFPVGIVALIVVAGAVAERQAWGWGGEGHEAVCEIAYRELTSTARATVDGIVAHDREFSTLREACVWPDRRGRVQDSRRVDHYINLPRRWNSLRDENCPTALHCLFTAIRRERGILLSPSASADERLTALKFLAHWIGDIHQPLHVSFADDKGGNRIILERGIGCRKTLHDVWDNCIPEDLMEESGAGQDRRRFAEKLHGEITNADRQKWTSKMSLVQWANESYAIARQPDVQYCFDRGKGCFYTEDGIEYRPKTREGNAGMRMLRLDSAYEDLHRPTVQTRLQQAGVRLGAVLNELFAP